MSIGLWAQVAVYTHVVMYISLDVDWDMFVFG